MNTSRRDFIKKCSLATLFLAAGKGLSGCGKQGQKQVLTIGIIADVHAASLPHANKHLQDFIDSAIVRKPDFIIQLGDFTGGKEFERTLSIWNSFPGKRYHVLGNHDMDYTDKETVIARQEMPGKYYSFDAGDYHFVILDANYILKNGQFIDYVKGNYYIPYPNRDLIDPGQLKWLAADLAATNRQTIIFSHEPFDDYQSGNPVPNRQEFRDVIRAANRDGQKVVACIAGHNHVDYYEEIEGVHYIEINSSLGYTFGKTNYKDSLYAYVTLDPNKGTLSIEGRRSEFNPPLSEKLQKETRPDILPIIRDREITF